LRKNFDFNGIFVFSKNVVFPVTYFHSKFLFTSQSENFFGEIDVLMVNCRYSSCLPLGAEKIKLFRKAVRISQVGGCQLLFSCSIFQIKEMEERLFAETSGTSGDNKAVELQTRLRVSEEQRERETSLR